MSAGPLGINRSFAMLVEARRMSRDHREIEFQEAVRRAYRAAGRCLEDAHVVSLARVYAEWAADAGEDVVQRVERALARSLGAIYAD
jgi:hypothetical protein